MFEAYTFRARVVPPLLVVIPGLGLIAASGFSFELSQIIGSTAVFGLGLVAAGFTRDRGKRVQEKLWEDWGGDLLVQGLRWSQNARPDVTRRHDAVATCVGSSLPTEEQEAADENAADLAYGHATETLRIRFRDDDRLRVYEDALAEYGMRRNCFGLRGPGTILAVITTLGSLGLWLTSTGPNPAAYLISAAASIVFIMFWQLYVTSDWVKTAADRYQTHFFETAIGEAHNIKDLRRDHPR